MQLRSSSKGQTAVTAQLDPHVKGRSHSQVAQRQISEQKKRTKQANDDTETAGF